MDQVKIKRPSLGRFARLGELFDARNDRFLGVVLVDDSSLPKGFIGSADINHATLNTVYSESLSKRLATLALNGDTKLNIVSGLLADIGGSGKYLNEKQESNSATSQSLLYSLSTKIETLDINEPNFSDHVRHTRLNAEVMKTATHIVTEIHWGAQIVIKLSRKRKQNESNSKFGGEGHAATSGGAAFKSIANLDIKLDGKKEDLVSGDFKEYSIQLYGDVVPEKGFSGKQDVNEMIYDFPDLVKKCNNGKGTPTQYGLFPLPSLLEHFKISNIELQPGWTDISDNVSDSFVSLFDQITYLKEKLHNLKGRIKEFEYCLGHEELKNVLKHEDDLSMEEIQLKSKLKSLLVKVRKEEAVVDALFSLRSEYLPENNAIFSNVEKFLQSTESRIRQKFNAAEKLKSENITFLQKSESVLQKFDHRESYILFVHQSIADLELQDALNWFLKLKKSIALQRKIADFIYVDYSIRANQDSLPNMDSGNKAKFYHYREGKLISSDVRTEIDSISICGKYEWQSNSGSFGDYLSKIGVFGVQWYYMTNTGGTVTITEEVGDKLKIIMNTGGILPFQLEQVAEMGKEFQDKTADGRLAKSTMTRELNCLKLIQKLNNSERVTTRVFTRHEMTVYLFANGVEATRNFKRI